MLRGTPRTPDPVRTSPSSTWGFQLSAESAASISRRGGTSSFLTPVAPVPTGRVTGIASNSSQGALRSPASAIGASAANRSTGSLQQEGIAHPEDSSLQFLNDSQTLADTRVPALRSTPREGMPPEVPRLRPDWQPNDGQGLSPRMPSSDGRLQRWQSSPERFASPSRGTPRAHDATTPRGMTPSGEIPVAAAHFVQQLAEMAARIERNAHDASELYGRSEMHEARITALQKASEACEDRIQRVAEHAQRAGVEQRQHVESLQRKLDDRGEAVEMKHHLQWAENRIHQLIARVAAAEEVTDQLRQYTMGPGKAWDVWEVAEARRDLEVMREELSQMKASGMVTPKMLADCVEPLRREQRQLTERIVQGLNSDVATIVETVMQEVTQVREIATLGEQTAQRDNAAIRQDLETLSISVRKELRDIAESSDLLPRAEFADSTHALQQEILVLADAVSQRQDGVSRQELRETLEVLWSEGTSSSANPRTFPQTAQLAQAVEELRVFVSQLAPHCEKVGDVTKEFESFRHEVPTRQEFLSLEQGLVARLDELCAARAVPHEANSGVDTGRHDLQLKAASNAEDAGRDFSSVLARTAIVRALAMHSMAVATTTSRDSKASRCYGESDLPPSNSLTADTVTRQEFFHALQDLRKCLQTLSEFDASVSADMKGVRESVLAMREELRSLRTPQHKADNHIVDVEVATSLIGRPWSGIDGARGVESNLESESNALQHAVALQMARSTLTRGLAIHAASVVASGIDTEEESAGEKLLDVGLQTSSRRQDREGQKSRRWKGQARGGDTRTRLADIEIAYEGLRKMMAEILNVVEREFGATSLEPGTRRTEQITGRDLAWLMSRMTVARAVALHSAEVSTAAKVEWLANLDSTHSSPR